jgi:hypothetical protein
MKFKIFFLAIFAFSSSSLYSQNWGIKDLIGKWSGTDSTSKTGTLNFIDSSVLILTIPGWGTFNTNYKIDVEKKPMWFDITIKKEENVTTLNGLLQFISNSEIKWQITFDEDRSAGFLPETNDNTQILKRQ